jgi:hypothetical protein
MNNVRADFAKQQIAAVCMQFGSQAGPLPDGVDGAQLLWALSGVESSFGMDCQPRHEPAFDVGGPYAAHLPCSIFLARYGAAGACSYGPLQLMICNAPLTYGPSSFDNLTLAMQASVTFLNSLLRHWKPQSLAQVGECWNAGHITPDAGYEQKLAVAYATPMVATSQENDDDE